MTCTDLNRPWMLSMCLIDSCARLKAMIPLRANASRRNHAVRTRVYVLFAQHCALLQCKRMADALRLKHLDDNDCYVY